MLELTSSGNTLELPSVAGAAPKIYGEADKLTMALNLPRRART